MVIITGFLAFAPATRASWGTPNMHQIIPMYRYPTWWDTSSSWYKACTQTNASSTGSTVIANTGYNYLGVAGGGPNTASVSDYPPMIAICHDHGINVVGYVDTNYGNRSVSDIRNDIDNWYSFYNVDGIFLDNMSNDSSTSTYYHMIWQYIQGKDPNHLRDDVIGNPGAAASTSWQLDDSTQAANELVVFEGCPTSNSTLCPGTTGFDSWSPPSWVTNWAYPSDLMVLIHDESSSSNMQSECSWLKSHNIANAGISSTSTWTDDLPSYWSSFLTACGPN